MIHAFLSIKNCIVAACSILNHCVGIESVADHAAVRASVNFFVLQFQTPDRIRSTRCDRTNTRSYSVTHPESILVAHVEEILHESKAGKGLRQLNKHDVVVDLQVERVKFSLGFRIFLGMQQVEVQHLEMILVLEEMRNDAAPEALLAHIAAIKDSEKQIPSLLVK